MNLNASDTLELVTADAADIDVLVSYKDDGPNASPTRSQVTAITTDTTTTICSSPSPATTRVVESISIRNKDTTTCTVTVQFNPGTGSTVEVYETLLAAGAHVEWSKEKGWPASSSSNLELTNLVVLAEDVANDADATFADITGLSFAVVADATYWFRATIPYTAAASTTGAAFAVNGPAAPTALYVRSSYPSADDTITQNAVDDYDLPAAGNGDTPAGALALIEGVIVPSDDGTVAMRFLSDVAESAITAKAGATLEWKRVL